METNGNEVQVQLLFDPLKPREIEILSLLEGGLSNEEIAQSLHLTQGTVKWYNNQIYSKLGAKSRTQAVNIAQEHDLLHSFRETVFGPIHLLNNLPTQVNSFVGREKESAGIKRLLESSRLVTILGAGGSGKTRLSLNIAKDLVDSYRDGIWLVELAAITDPKLVPNAISNVLSINARGDTSYLELLKKYLERKQLLLILDNFEHLEVAAPLVGEFLATAPGLTVLVTSRAKLNIYGEQEYPLNPLSLPNLDEIESSDSLLDYEAINLFIQRAKAAQPGLNLDKDQMKAIARICVRLDGLPLAIELSAPLVKIYGLATLAERLENDLDTLPEGPSDLPERQRTLRATMDWSYLLLEDDEKKLFVRLSVFSNGGTLEAVESVCAKGLSGNMVDRLASLVEKNLIFPVEASDGEMYFRMLETIKEYSHEHLTSLPEESEIYRKHASYYAELADRSSKEIRGQRHRYWFQRLTEENQNLRSALNWSLEGDEPEFGLRMVGALMYHWYYNAVSAENNRWIELALEKSNSSDPALRAAVLQTAGNIAYHQNQLEKGRRYLQNALKIYQELEDEFGEATVLSDLSLVSIGSSSELTEALVLAKKALKIFRKLDDKGHIAHSYNIMGELARAQGDIKAAKKHYQLCLALSEETGEKLREAMQFINLSFIAFHEGDYVSAEQLNKRGLSEYIDMDSTYGIATHLASLAGPVAALGNPKRAARLLGAAFAQMEALSSNPQPADQAEVDQYISLIKKEIDEETFQEAWLEGQRMSIQEAATYALSDEEAGGMGLAA